LSVGLKGLSRVPAASRPVGDALAGRSATPAEESCIMTDETRSDQPPTETPGETATAVSEPPAEATDKKPEKLQQTVDLTDLGPCKKHIKVAIAQVSLDRRRNEKFTEIVRGTTSSIAGFRPGKAPRKLIERQYRKEVEQQLKSEVLLASLEQLAEDYEIAPLSPPNIDPAKIVLPEKGDFVYEFEVEVRPQFDLPPYKGLKLRRPVHTFSAEEKVAEKRRLLSTYAQIIPKEDGTVAPGDVLVATVVTRDGDRLIGEMKESTFHVEKQLAFKDGVASKFAEQVVGARAGDNRLVDITLSQSVSDPALRGKTLQAEFHVQDVKTLRLPELTHEFLHTFGLHTPEQFDELIDVLLRRRLATMQRQSARAQVIEQLGSAALPNLPEELLQRQARKAMQRKIMEWRSDGVSEAEIVSRERLHRQDVLRNTARSMQENFILQRVAELEKIEVSDDEINAEIERLANQADESPRKLRARLEKEDLMETLTADLYERKALDIILDSADYEDVELRQDDEPPATATSEGQAVPGTLEDPTTTPPEAPANPS
jgi:trigger factor